MSIFSKLLGRSGGDGDPDQPVIVAPAPNAEGVGGAHTETIGAARSENVANPEVGDEVLVAFEHGDAPADPDGGGEATGDPFAVKIEHVVPPGEPGGVAELQENLSINFAKFELDTAASEPDTYVHWKLEGEDVEPPGDLAAGAAPSATPAASYIKFDPPPGDDVVTEGGIVAATHKVVGPSKLEEDPGGGPVGDEVILGGVGPTNEAPAGADDGSIPTETLSLNFDKITLHGAPGGPGANELSTDDSAGGSEADGGGAVGELAKKASGEQESVKVTSYSVNGSGLDDNPEGLDDLAVEPGAMMKESGEKGGTEDILIGMPDDPPAFDPGFRGGVSVGAGDVGEGGSAPTGDDLLVGGTTTYEGPAGGATGEGDPGANELSTDGSAEGYEAWPVKWYVPELDSDTQSAPSISEIVVTKTTDSTSPTFLEDDDDGATLESLAVQEPDAIGGAIGGSASEGAGAPDLDDLDMDDDGDMEL